MQVRIDRDRLLSDIEMLASFSDGTPPGISRLVFADADQEARIWLRAQCRDAGLSVREDAVGNMFARWTGARPELGAIGTGSHIDAIPHSGKFDGTVGVLGGLEAIRALRQSGFQPQRSIELLLFTAEEPTRFGLGCLGSRMLGGGLDSAADTRLRDPEGNSLAQLRAAGFAPRAESEDGTVIVETRRPHHSIGIRRTRARSSVTSPEQLAQLLRP